MALLRWFAAVALGGCLIAGDDPRSLEARPGKTPVLDGVISPGEWDDATMFLGVEGCEGVCQVGDFAVTR